MLNIPLKGMKFLFLSKFIIYVIFCVFSLLSFPQLRGRHSDTLTHCDIHKGKYNSQTFKTPIK